MHSGSPTYSEGGLLNGSGGIRHNFSFLGMSVAHESGRGSQSRDGGIEAHDGRTKVEKKGSAQHLGGGPRRSVGETKTGLRKRTEDRSGGYIQQRGLAKVQVASSWQLPNRD